MLGNFRCTPTVGWLDGRGINYTFSTQDIIIEWLSLYFLVDRGLSPGHFFSLYRDIYDVVVLWAIDWKLPVWVDFTSSAADEVLLFFNVKAKRALYISHRSYYCFYVTMKARKGLLWSEKLSEGQMSGMTITHDRHGTHLGKHNTSRWISWIDPHVHTTCGRPGGVSGYPYRSVWWARVPEWILVYIRRDVFSCTNWLAESACSRTCLATLDKKLTSSGLLNPMR